MCLYAKERANAKYRANKSNGGKAPLPMYQELLRIDTKCGYCLECRKQRANGWRIRLQNEILDHKENSFVTMTFSDEALDQLIAVAREDEPNRIATIAIRRFLERYRKHHGKSLRHWFIVELGGSGTERMHIHGIIFGGIDAKELQDRWTYGRTDVGYECSQRTINYVTKYLTKIDPTHREFRSIILVSPALGKSYIEKYRNEHRFRWDQTNTKYRLSDGREVELPEYYKRKLYSDEEREQLRMLAYAEGKRYVGRTEYIVQDHKQFMVFIEAKTAYVRKMEALGFPSPAEQKHKRYKARNRVATPIIT